MPEKKTTSETKNADVAWDRFASVRHDENALEGLEKTLMRHPEIGRLYDPDRHPQRRVHTSARHWSLVYDYEQDKSVVVILDVTR